jgi:hypothetical protein
MIFLQAYSTPICYKQRFVIAYAGDRRNITYFYKFTTIFANAPETAISVRPIPILVSI